MKKSDTKQKPKRRRIPKPRAMRAWRRQSREKKIRKVQAHLDEVVVTWDDVVASPARFGGGGRRKLLFMHIPKTGGSTLDNVIPQNYELNATVHVNPPHFRRDPAVAFRDGAFTPIVLGHFKFDSIVYTFTAAPLAHLTVLREPIGRIISHYNFKLTTSRRDEPGAGAEGDFERYFSSLDNNECHNGQVLRVAGMLDRRTIGDPAAIEAALDIAKENLTRRFTFFGVTERYPEFILMCQRLLGWRHIYYTKKKVTPDVPGRVHLDTLDPGVLEALREQNRVDIAFYEFAKRLADERIAQLGITEDDVAEFRRRNAVFGELIARPVGSGAKVRSGRRLSGVS
jgi:hypothetical protein